VFFCFWNLFSVFAECRLKIVAAGSVPNTARLHASEADSLCAAVTLSCLKYRGDARCWLQRLDARTDEVIQGMKENGWRKC
jgi:hypothetical protein